MRKQKSRWSVFAVLLIACVFLSAMPTPAAEEAVLSVGQKTASPGETIRLPITIQNNPGFAFIKVNLYFDSAVFEPANDTSLIKGDVTKNGSLTFNPVTADPTRCLFICDDLRNMTGDGEIAVLTLTLRSTAPAGKTTIRLEYSAKDTCDENGTAVPMRCENGFVTVTGSGNGAQSGGGNNTGDNTDGNNTAQGSSGGGENAGGTPAENGGDVSDSPSNGSSSNGDTAGNSSPDPADGTSTGQGESAIGEWVTATQSTALLGGDGSQTVWLFVLGGILIALVAVGAVFFMRRAQAKK